MRSAFKVIVNNSYDTRPTAPGFHIFFQLKRASRKPFSLFRAFFQWRCVLRSRWQSVNLHVMRSSGPTFLIFSKENAYRRNPAAFLRFTFLVLSQAIPVLRWEVIVNLHVMRPTAPWLNIFRRKTRLAGGIPRGSHCHCKFSFVPKPGRKPNLDKGTLYRRCWVIWLSVPHKPRVALAKGKLQNACHTKRLGCQRWHITDCLLEAWMWWSAPNLKHDRAIPKRTAVQGRERNDEIVLSICAAQCGSMEAKALSFVLRAAGKVNITSRQPSAWCSGRAGENERRLLFYARYEETWPYRTSSLWMN